MPDESYAPARRLQQLRTMLLATGGMTHADIMERLEVSKQTARRLVHALEAAGEPVVEDTLDGRKVWRLMDTARPHAVRMTTSELTTLVLARKVFGVFAGTGFEDDLESLSAQLTATLKKQDAALAQNLDKKLFDVNEHAYVYEGRAEQVDAVLTALLRDERIAAKHVSVDRGATAFTIDPYSLLIYKKGLYVVGRSHHPAHPEPVRTFALDGFVDIDWLRGDRFDYPGDYDPRALVKDKFGLFGGEMTRVRVRFDKKVVRAVTRRTWHASQRIEARDDGSIELTMDVAGTVEVVSWVLGFGATAEVLEPETLRAEIARELGRARERYAP